MSLLVEIEKLLEEGKGAIKNAASAETLENVRVAYLGRSGKIKEMMGRIREVANEEKKAFGQGMNDLKKSLEKLFDEQKNILGSSKAKSGPQPDPTLPGQSQPRGSRHPLTQVTEHVVKVFERLGFTIADGPEMEDEFHNFVALNIPDEHPAREDQDTFGLDNGTILRSQTSTVQIRTMEKIQPPVRVIAPGRVYRPDAVDATHFYSFGQIEGLAVDTDITFADLKSVLGMFAREMFGSDTKTRFRPSFFPFTEPSAEVDVTCIFCHGKGCRVCKQQGWIEILGCGMVDPNVFKSVGYDPEAWTGFAFGMGVERVAMLTLGVDDIRRFTENDLRFLRQF